jgi:hypothetical protein
MVDGGSEDETSVESFSVRLLCPHKSLAPGKPHFEERLGGASMLYCVTILGGFAW